MSDVDPRPGQGRCLQRGAHVGAPLLGQDLGSSSLFAALGHSRALAAS